VGLDIEPFHPELCPRLQFPTVTGIQTYGPPRPADPVEWLALRILIQQRFQFSLVFSSRLCTYAHGLESILTQKTVRTKV